MVASPQRAIFCARTVSVSKRAVRWSRYVPVRSIAAPSAGPPNATPRWPIDSIDELGAEVLLVGSAAEAQVSLEVARQMRRQPVVLAGQTDLAELVGILSQIDLLVTNDTGPAHIASALSRPTIVVFGPTNPLTTRPFSPFGEIVREPPDCAPCMLRDCPIDHRCMTAITPDDIFARARTVLYVRQTSVCRLPTF